MRWFIDLLRKFWATDPVDRPSLPTKHVAWNRERARERQNTEMQEWLRSWNGNGTVEEWTPEEYARILARGSILHDHPHSRGQGTGEPCPECRFPDLGWGGWDHYETCSKKMK